MSWNCPLVIRVFFVSFLFLQRSRYGRERAGCFTLTTFLRLCMYFCYMCILMSPPRGTIGWILFCVCDNFLVIVITICFLNCNVEAFKSFSMLLFHYLQLVQHGNENCYMKNAINYCWIHITAKSTFNDYPIV